MQSYCPRKTASNATTRKKDKVEAMDPTKAKNKNANHGINKTMYDKGQQQQQHTLHHFSTFFFIS